MGRPYTARACRVAFRVGGVIRYLLASRVTVHTNSDRIDVTNFESGNDGSLFYGDFLAGVTSATVNIESYDSDVTGDVNDHWSLGLKSGINAGELFIYLDGGVGKATSGWYFPILTVIDVSTESEAHGAIKNMIQVMNRGRFYYPGDVKPVAAF